MFWLFYDLIPNMKVRRFCQGLSVVSGLYGFSRGYRGCPEDHLFLQKVAMSSYNGLIYSMPFTMFIPMISLGNRIEVKIRQLDQERYASHFTEVTGICWDTL